MEFRDFIYIYFEYKVSANMENVNVDHFQWWPQAFEGTKDYPERYSVRMGHQSSGTLLYFASLFTGWEYLPFGSMLSKNFLVWGQSPFSRLKWPKTSSAVNLVYGWSEYARPHYVLIVLLWSKKVKWSTLEWCFLPFNVQ